MDSEKENTSKTDQEIVEEYIEIAQKAEEKDSPKEVVLFLKYLVVSMDDLGMLNMQEFRERCTNSLKELKKLNDFNKENIKNILYEDEPERIEDEIKEAENLGCELEEAFSSIKNGN